MVAFNNDPHDSILSHQQISQNEDLVVKKLIEHFAGYIQVLASRFKSTFYDYSEIVHIGNIAIFRAVRSYDAKKGDIYSYVRKSIRNAIFEVGRKTKALRKKFDCQPYSDFDTALTDSEPIVKNKDLDRVDFTDALPVIRDRISRWRTKLNTKQNRLIELFFYNDMCQSEVAPIMGLTRSRIGQVYKEIIDSGRINLKDISEI